MGKKILVITGSPRRNGNSDLMAEAFTKGATKAGHTVTSFCAAAYNLRGCLACNGCYSKENACVFNDGFNELAPLVLEATVVVFCAPLYFFSFPAQIKAGMDKFYSFMVGKKPIQHKESVLLTCGESDVMADYDPLVKCYERMVDYLQWKDLGRHIAVKVWDKGDIQKTPDLPKVEALGASI